MQVPRFLIRKRPITIRTFLSDESLSERDEKWIPDPNKNGPGGWMNVDTRGIFERMYQEEKEYFGIDWEKIRKGTNLLSSSFGPIALSQSVPSVHMRLIDVYEDNVDQN